MINVVADIYLPERYHQTEIAPLNQGEKCLIIAEPPIMWRWCAGNGCAVNQMNGGPSGRHIRNSFIDDDEAEPMRWDIADELINSHWPAPNIVHIINGHNPVDIGLGHHLHKWWWWHMYRWAGDKRWLVRYNIKQILGLLRRDSLPVYQNASDIDPDLFGYLSSLSLWVLNPIILSKPTAKDAYTLYDILPQLISFVYSRKLIKLPFALIVDK